MKAIDELNEIKKIRLVDNLKWKKLAMLMKKVIREHEKRIDSLENDIREIHLFCDGFKSFK